MGPTLSGESARHSLSPPLFLPLCLLVLSVFLSQLNKIRLGGGEYLEEVLQPGNIAPTCPRFEDGLSLFRGRSELNQREQNPSHKRPLGKVEILDHSGHDNPGNEVEN